MVPPFNTATTPHVCFYSQFVGISFCKTKNLLNTVPVFFADHLAHFMCPCVATIPYILKRNAVGDGVWWRVVTTLAGTIIKYINQCGIVGYNIST